MRDINAAVALTTGKKLLRNTMGIVAVLCAVAIPGYSSTSFLSFTGSNPQTGTIQINGDSASETLTSLSGISYQTLNVSNALDANDDGTWAVTGTVGLSGNTLTLNGSIGSCTAGACLGDANANLKGISGNLETIVVTGLPYNAGVGSGFTTNFPTQNSITVTYGAPTSITDLAALLTAIDGGSNFSVSTTETAGSIVGTGNGVVNGSTYTFGGTSETMSLTLTETPVTTPEPVSFLMLGSGLLGIALVMRRRSVKA